MLASQTQSLVLEASDVAKLIILTALALSQVPPQLSFVYPSRPSMLFSSKATSSASRINQGHCF